MHIRIVGKRLRQRVRKGVRLGVQRPVGRRAAINMSYCISPDFERARVNAQVKKSRNHIESGQVPNTRLPYLALRQWLCYRSVVASRHFCSRFISRFARHDFVVYSRIIPVQTPSELRLLKQIPFASASKNFAVYGCASIPGSESWSGFDLTPSFKPVRLAHF